MKKPIALHPFLLAVYPILFLVAHNAGQVTLRSVVVPLGIAIGTTIVLWSLLRWLHNDGRKTALIVSLFWALFFSYGRVSNGIQWLIEDKIVGPRLLVAANAALLIFYGAILMVGSWYFIKKVEDPAKWTRLANKVALFLVALSLLGFGFSQLKLYGFHARATSAQPPTSQTQVSTAVRTTQPAELPDIYYIILDGYGRADVLKEMYHLDNDEFLGYLKTKGFYVVPRSRSNYCQTGLSLASSLNLNYLDELVKRADKNSDNRVPLRKLIANNEVFKFLKALRYTIVTIPCEYSLTDVKANVDLHLSPRLVIDEFQDELINTTAIPAVISLFNFRHSFLRYRLKRERILYNFAALGETSKRKGPLFVFCHIFAPHPPFVFGAGGEEVQPNRPFSFADGSGVMGTQDEYVEAYKGQLLFLNKKVEELVGVLLSRSNSPPIIILQGDHGPGSKYHEMDAGRTDARERFSIFNAYHFPGFDYTKLAAEVSPVNTFRIVFNHYFGTTYDVLRDESYFSTWSRPYDFINVTDRAKSGETDRHSTR